MAADARDLLARLESDDDLAEVAANSFEFDLSRKPSDPSMRLSSGAPLKGIAGDFTGGSFYLCKTDMGADSLLYASSEGQAGIIASDLANGLEVLVGLPYWHDCLGFSAGGDLETMRRAAGFLQRDAADYEDLGPDQRRITEALGLRLEPVEVLVERLHASVVATRDLKFSDSDGEYEGLFGDFTPERNPSWRS